MLIVHSSCIELLLTLGNYVNTRYETVNVNE